MSVMSLVPMKYWVYYWCVHQDTWTQSIPLAMSGPVPCVLGQKVPGVSSESLLS